MRRRVRKEQEKRTWCCLLYIILKKILHLPAEIVPLHRKILKESVGWRENIKGNMALTIIIYSTHQEAGDFEFWSLPLGLFQYFIQWLFNTKYLSTRRYSNAQFKAACVYVWWKRELMPVNINLWCILPSVCHWCQTAVQTAWQPMVYNWTQTLAWHTWGLIKTSKGITKLQR